MSTRFLTLRPASPGETPVMPNARQSIAGTRGVIARKAKALDLMEIVHQDNLSLAAELASAQRVEYWNKKFQSRKGIR